MTKNRINLALILLGLTSFNLQAQDQPVFTIGVQPDLNSRPALPAQAPVRATTNPFAVGVYARPITPAEMRQYAQYMNDSRQLLLEAKRNAQGRTSEEAKEIYKAAIMRIVPQSSQNAGSLELLMRVALNQGLDLVEGIPGDTKRLPALYYSENNGLKARVLEGAIDMAVNFFLDPSALKGDGIINIQYREFAWNRLQQTLLWWAGIEDSAVALEFVERSLGHWLAVAQMAKNDVPLMAQEMVDVHNILEKFKATRSNFESMSGEEQDKELRVLRDSLFNLLESMKNKKDAQ